MADKSEEIEKLKLTCFNLAKDTMWERRPIDTDLITTHADNLFKIASDHLEFHPGVSVEIITRAVGYLHQIHAIPPMANDTMWFENMLSVLLEIACPNAGLDGDSREFLRDLLNGIIESLFDIN